MVDLLEKDARLTAHDALQTERAFSAALLENLQEGIVACDADGVLTLFNRASREFHDLPAAPLPPEAWAEHFDLYQADGLTPLATEDIPLYRAFRGETVRDAGMVIAPRNGPARSILAGGGPLFGAGGEKIGAVIVMRDVTDRLAVERELARLAAIVESSEEAIIAGTLDGTIVAWNRGAERLYGFSAGEMIGRHWSVLAPPQEKALGPEIVLRLASGETIPPLEIVRTHRSGGIFHASLSLSPIHNGAGQMIGVSCISRDITARKQAEAALAKTHASLRAVLEGAPIILYATDADGTVTLSEGTGLTALGLSPGEAVGRSVFEFIGNAESEAQMRRAMAGEDVTYDAQAGPLRLHTELRPTRDDGGCITGLIGVCFDVTERAASEERFRALFEHSSDAHMLVNEETGIIDCNDAAVALMGCAGKAQMLSLHPGVFSPERQPDGRLSREKAREMDVLARQRGFHRFEWMHRRMDGAEVPVEVSLTPITLQERPALLAVVHDLTERRHAQERIQDYNTVLEFQKAALEKANVELERANADLAALATTDGLTGLTNHRAFQERMAEEAARAARYGLPLSVVFLDVDRFKHLNDTHGHPAGDEVLRDVARLLRLGVRDGDLAARYGGEEFALILPQTDMTGAAAVAERIRCSLEGHPWPLRPVTASFGVASLRPGEDAAAPMIARADAALYRAKAAGRNLVTADAA